MKKIKYSSRYIPRTLTPCYIIIDSTKTNGAVIYVGDRAQFKSNSRNFNGGGAKAKGWRYSRILCEREGFDGYVYIGDINCKVCLSIYANEEGMCPNCLSLGLTNNEI